jgi:hypothetical protein
MKMRLTFAIAIAASLSMAYGDSVTITSGAGVTFLDSGLTSTDFPSPFTAANFAAAQTGKSAFVLTSTPYYIASLPSGPGAVWLGTNSTAGTGVGDTALYAVSFNIADPFSVAALNLYYAVDNELGGKNAGIYLNGIALPSTTGIGTFSSQFNYTDANVAADLVQGTNWLYLDAVNLGAPAGVIFSATVTTTNLVAATPEPVTLFLFAAGLILAGCLARHGVASNGARELT